MLNNNYFIDQSVLIVDDDLYALEELEEALLEYGLTVHKATNSNDAVTLAMEFKPSFILMDFHLPDTDGLETTAMIRNFLPDVEVIMISGQDSFIAEANIRNTGSTAVLRKPVSVESISRFISNKLNV
ncbi:MAG: response regulator [Gammaproteobacteria bacterium]|nr:response regulator [Gammaproteobacteria bacterium]